jgi:hypothetical protein
MDWDVDRIQPPKVVPRRAKEAIRTEKCFYNFENGAGSPQPNIFVAQNTSFNAKVVSYSRIILIDLLKQSR